MKTASNQDPQQLIHECQGLVRSLAVGIRRKLPPNIELDDLIAYGQVGLAQAAQDFDAGRFRQTQFSTYAYYRIRGAIYDGLSKMSWFSRSQYRQVRAEQMTNEVLQVEGQQGAFQRPSQAGLQESSDAGWFRDATCALAVVRLATRSGQGIEDGAPMTPADPSTPDPSVAAMGREISQKLRELIDALPEAESALIRAAYFEGLTLQEAGQRLGISKSWASRLHTKTLKHLARSLKLLGVVSST